MTQSRITLIGLGLIGGSIGLALKASGAPVHVVGHDIDPDRNKLAQKKGAVDKSIRNLFDACRDADLVIIATPITAIRETLALIGPHLKQGCIVTDTAPLKEPVLAWAAETLPTGISFVGGDPVLPPAAQHTDLLTRAGLESARDDLFQGALYALCAPVNTTPTAIKRVTGMIQLIQARPFYIDPTEHDGMRAAVEGLPALLSLALMQDVSGSPGWREARKLADDIFGMATVPLSVDAAHLLAQILLSADHLLPRLKALINELTRLCEWIKTEDATALEEALDQASLARNQWLSDRARAEWQEETVASVLPETRGTLGHLFGLGRRQPKRKDE